LEKDQGIVKFLIFERINSLEDKQFGLGEARAKTVEGFELFQFLFPRFGLAMRAQRDAKIVMGFFEIRPQSDGTLKRGDGSGCIARCL